MSLAPRLRAGESGLSRFLVRSPQPDAAIQQTVQAVIQAVRERGLAATLEFTERHSGVRLSSPWVTADELASATVPDDLADALRLAIDRVRRFHEAQLEALTQGWQAAESGWQWTIPARDTTNPTGKLGQRLLPLQRVGVYVPGGKGTYPSTLIMNAVPALAAGVQEVVVASPPQPDGSLADAVLWTARELGITRILKAGGAEAISLLALGDPDFLRVDALSGPGNRYVNEAKRQLWGTVGLDMYAGPSEVAVLALPGADPKLAALDWLIQVEHSEDNAGLLVTLSSQDADAIESAARSWIEGTPRAEILRAALRDHGAVLVADSTDEAVQAIQAFAPEHVSVHGPEAEAVAPKLTLAGCVLVGAATPQSAGDFVAGPSHTLPTSGAARFASPVNLMNFLRFQSWIALETEDTDALHPAVRTMGEAEGFPLHARGAEDRKPH